MENKRDYVIVSLSLHLFFARLMKEHVIFLQTGFMPKDEAFAKEADHHKTQFEKLLTKTVELSNGVLPSNVMDSNEFVTKHTLKAEKQTQFLTGIEIDQSITVAENVLKTCKEPKVTPGMIHQVKQLNRHAMRLLNGIICFKERLLKQVSSCQMAIGFYPSFISHTIHEANMYRKCLMCAETKPYYQCNTAKQEQLFWNEIMKEHALFMAGLLDPTEILLIGESHEFAEQYETYLATLQTTKEKELNLEEITEETLRETILFKDFKESAVKGIADCNIKSMILPLLSDHVLREAFYYIRLLKNELLA